MESTFNYLARRLLWVPAILLFVTFVAFALARFGPGDPVRVASGKFRDPEAFERIRQDAGSMTPAHPVLHYMKGVVTRLDFGDSSGTATSRVNEIIFPAMWRSMQYNTVALALTVGVGIPLGI